MAFSPQLWNGLNTIYFIHSIEIWLSRWHRAWYIGSTQERYEEWMNDGWMYTHKHISKKRESSFYGPTLQFQRRLFLVTQSYPTLCNPLGCNLPGSSVMEILQARILEWVAVPSSRGSSWPRDRTQVSRITGGFFTVWVNREAQRLLTFLYV